MNVLMPLFAASVAWAFELPTPIEIGLVALAVSPVPPLLPQKQAKARGEHAYSISLLVVAAGLAILLVPLSIELLGWALGREAHMLPWPVAKLVFATVFAPLMAGMLVNRFAPALAPRLSRPVALVGGLALATFVVPVLFTAWPAIAALLGGGALNAIAAFVGLGLAVGHTLGGPDPHERTVLALATATRHPGVALAIGAANFPDQKVVPAILLYLVVAGVLAIPYVMWRTRRT
jgi:BASS family bile acid:Na+ symporter